MATVESPPTIPAVYHAALISKGPPKKVRGATTAPMTPNQRENNTHKICNCSGKTHHLRKTIPPTPQSGNTAPTDPLA